MTEKRDRGREGGRDRGREAVKGALRARVPNPGIRKTATTACASRDEQSRQTEREREARENATKPQVSLDPRSLQFDRLSLKGWPPRKGEGDRKGGRHAAATPGCQNQPRSAGV